MSVDLENDDGISEEIEQEARNMGWVPQEEFRGNKDHWVDADEFVERGRTVMPILLQNNKRLQKEIDKRNADIDNLRTKLQNAETVMTKLEKHYTEANKRAVDIAKVQLREELKQAREDNDLDKELEVQERLDDLRQREAEVEVPAKKDEPKPKGNEYTPEFKEWLGRNPWFDKDKKKTKLVTRIAEDLREEGSDLQGVEFFDECVRVYDEQYGESDDSEDKEEKKPVRRPTSKVDSSSNRGGGRGGKSWNDLPAAAKQVCDEDADDLVGPGKRYKNLKDWRDQYAKIYFAED